MSEKKKRLVLLDTHAILHRAYHALPDFTSSKGEPTGGLYGLATMLMRIIADLKPDYIAAICQEFQNSATEISYRKQKLTKSGNRQAFQKSLPGVIIIMTLRMERNLVSFIIAIPLRTQEAWLLMVGEYLQIKTGTK